MNTQTKFKIHYDKKYRIITPSEHFKKKYGDERPVITMLERDTEVFGASWNEKMNVPAVVAFMLRVIHDGNMEINYTTPAYYGKIITEGTGFMLGEVVFKSELEPVE